MADTPRTEIRLPATQLLADLTALIAERDRFRAAIESIIGVLGSAAPRCATAQSAIELAIAARDGTEPPKRTWERLDAAARDRGDAGHARQDGGTE